MSPEQQAVIDAAIEETNAEWAWSDPSGGRVMDDDIPTVVFGIPLHTVAKAVMFAADWADAKTVYGCRSHNRDVRFSEAEMAALRSAPLGVAE